MPRVPYYTRRTDFSEEERRQASGRDRVNTAKLDAELAGLGNLLNQVNQALQRIQRDDGLLRDGSVTAASLGQDVRNMINSRVEVIGPLELALLGLVTSPNFIVDRPETQGQATAALAIAALTAANRTAQGVEKDLTPPPAPSGVIVTARALGLEIKWTPASYTVGHGHAGAIVYGAHVANGAASDWAYLGYTPVSSSYLFPVDPGSTWNIRVTFVSSDGVESLPSASVTATAQRIIAAHLADDLSEAKTLAEGIETGRLIADPTFASEGAGWTNFVSRSSDVPLGAPGKVAARFTGRDGLRKRTVSVSPGQVYRASVYCNPLDTGLGVGVVISPTGSVMEAASIAISPNTWGQAFIDYTVPSGVVEISVGPYIEQPSNGTAVALFTGIELTQHVQTSLLTQGSMTAASIAAVDAAFENITVSAANVVGKLTAAELVVGAVSLQRQLSFALYTVAMATNASASSHWSSCPVFQAPASARLMAVVEDSFTLECGPMVLEGAGTAAEPAMAYVDTDLRLFVDGEYVAIQSGLNDTFYLCRFPIGIETGDLGTQVSLGFKRSSTRNFAFVVPHHPTATTRSLQIQIQKTVSIFDSQGRRLRTATNATTKFRLKGQGVVHENRV